MIKVFLREKLLKHGKKGLYLDFYPPIIHPDTFKSTRRQHLRLYVYGRPKTETERDHNKETRLLGENIRSQRQLELQSGAYGFVSQRNKQKDFTTYYRRIVEAKKPKSREEASTSIYDTWAASLRHFEIFAGKTHRFSSITENFCKEFRDYLLNNANLSRNTAASYYDRYRSAISQSVKDKILLDNPTDNIAAIAKEETQREFLTLDELQALAQTPFKYEDLRRAALFSALTGLRFSDIEKLTWNEIQHSKEQGYYVRFRQKKTKGIETLPISEEAYQLLGECGEAHTRVLRDLKYSQCAYLPVWMAQARIDKEITFHSFRHTFATLQLTLGTDLYTVSKLLGHRDIKTTQIYAKIIDEKKREAANKITLK